MKFFAIQFAILFALLEFPLPAMEPLRIEREKILAGSQEIRLRGINWGWWQEKGTRYTENDMKNQAEWGANVLRLTFSYCDLTDANGVWSEAKADKLDEVIAWAARYRQYVILDMHEIPGGQSPVHYCAGGANAFWTSQESRQHFFALWQRLAMRYRGNSAVGAYELMNEPCPPKSVSTMAMMGFYRQAIAAIRTVDPDKIIVVSGGRMSDPEGLTDEIKLADGNILYTFHFYHSWLGNVGEKQPAAIAAGNTDWQEQELTFTLPETVSRINIMLRSDSNRGSALFDDVTLTDGSGKKLLAFGFDRNPEGFSPERMPRTCMTFEPREGAAAPGSLRISATQQYNGFQYPWIIQGTERRFTLKAKLKLKNATGSSYIAISQFGWKSPEQLRQALKAPIRFRQKYQVPVWVGEFGVTCDTPQSQEQAVTDHIRVFEEQHFHWTYWNYHETTQPNQMALQAQHRNADTSYPLNLTLLRALQSGWRLN